MGAGANTFTGASGAGVFFDSTSGFLSASARALSMTDGVNFTFLTDGKIDYRMDLISFSSSGGNVTAQFDTDGVVGPDLILRDGATTLLEASFNSFTITGESGGATADGEGYLTVTGGSLQGDFGPFAGLVHFQFQIGAPGFTATSDYSGRVSGDVAPAPEPGSMILLGSGLSALGIYMRRRRNRQ
jgi:hypothetical protein